MFDNSFSIISNKVVDVSLVAEWSEKIVKPITNNVISSVQVVKEC